MITPDSNIVFAALGIYNPALTFFAATAYTLLLCGWGSLFFSIVLKKTKSFYFYLAGSALTGALTFGFVCALSLHWQWLSVSQLTFHFVGIGTLGLPWLFLSLKSLASNPTFSNFREVKTLLKGNAFLSFAFWASICSALVALIASLAPQVHKNVVDVYMVFVETVVRDNSLPDSRMNSLFSLPQQIFSLSQIPLFHLKMPWAATTTQMLLYLMAFMSLKDIKFSPLKLVVFASVVATSLNTQMPTVLVQPSALLLLSFFFWSRHEVLKSSSLEATLLSLFSVCLASSSNPMALVSLAVLSIYFAERVKSRRANSIVFFCLLAPWIVFYLPLHFIAGWESLVPSTALGFLQHVRSFVFAVVLSWLLTGQIQFKETLRWTPVLLCLLAATNLLLNLVSNQSQLKLVFKQQSVFQFLNDSFEIAKTFQSLDSKLPQDAVFYSSKPFTPAVYFPRPIYSEPNAFAADKRELKYQLVQKENLGNSFFSPPPNFCIGDKVFSEAISGLQVEAFQLQVGSTCP